MKRIIAATALVITAGLIALSHSGVGAQTPATAQVPQATKSNPQSQSPGKLALPEQEFIKLEQEWMEAVQKQDDPALNRIMARDFVHTTSMIPGRSTDKAQFIEVSVQPTTRLGTFSFDQVVVRLVGDLAVVNALYSQKARQGEISFNGDYFLTDIWVKRDNRWQVLARNLMRAQKEPTQPAGRQVANNQVANNEKVRKPLSPCQTQCREQFDNATKLCRVKASDGEEDSYEYNIICMQNAQKTLRSCNTECRNEKKAEREAKQKDRQSVREGKPKSETP